MALLAVKNLSIGIRSHNGTLPIVHGVSFELERSSTLGIVGESGCGKSLTAFSIMGLTEGTPIEVTGGSIRYRGRELCNLPMKARRRFMGRELAMIFQEPMTSLNPVYTIGAQILESIRQHHNLSRNAAKEKMLSLLEDVRIPNPQRRQYDFPHQMSGGMRQRVMIAMAISCAPQILIADEATTALDVTVQAEILDLLSELQQSKGMALLMISHDLGVISQTCSQVAVMYCGRIVEFADTRDLFNHPQHPYTVGLMRSIPDLQSETHRLKAIEGVVPLPDQLPPGCSFHPRCPRFTERCLQPFSEQQLTQSVLCHHPH